MKALWAISLRMLKREWWAYCRGTLLAVAVLAAGAALLGLSGWFITAAGIAGLAGTGLVFDVFRPSAGVRFLALGRTAARYGERMLTHDATLRSLAALRLDLLGTMLAWPFLRAGKARASEWLNRFTTDIDALDGIALRLVIPVLAATSTLVLTLLALAWLTKPVISLIVFAGLVPLTLLALVRLLRGSKRPARLAHQARAAFRMRTIDTLRARTDLVMAGSLEDRVAATLAADDRARAALREIDRAERRSGFTIMAAETLAATALLAVGIVIVRAEALTAPLFAMAFFAVIALGETVGPLRRGFGELTRMADAAQRIAPLLRPEPASAATPSDTEADGTGEQGLCLEAVCYRYEGAAEAVVEGFSLVVQRGETVVLQGPSGRGKSTVLHLMAGVIEPSAGCVGIDGTGLRRLDRATRRRLITLLPQRPALMSGTIREALALARPELDDAEAWAVLEAVALDRAIAQRGGLDSRLGEGGSGLSGGERRRLAIARMLLRRPDFLLLDEPAEGLDAETADTVLSNIRAWLPKAGIVMASHRERDRMPQCRVVTMR